jgi:hypothetical protein
MKVPPLRYGQIYKITFGLTQPIKQYEVTIGNFPTCTCLDFIRMMANSLGDCGKWAHCKHLYLILQDVMHCGQIEDVIHFPTWSWNEVQKLTSRARAILFE